MSDNIYESVIKTEIIRTAVARLCYTLARTLKDS